MSKVPIVPPLVHSYLRNTLRNMFLISKMAGIPDLSWDTLLEGEKNTKDDIGRRHMRVDLIVYSVPDQLLYEVTQSINISSS